jgi:hypothetical protein
MTWNLRYQVKSYVRDALWIIPFVAVLLEQVTWWIARTADHSYAWSGLRLTVAGAEALFGTVSSLWLSFVVFTFASLFSGDSGCRRPVLSANHRDDVYPVFGGDFRFQSAFRGQSSWAGGGHRSPAARVHHGAAGFDLHCGFLISDRSRSQNVAPGEFGKALRGGRSSGCWIARSRGFTVYPRM